MKKIFGLIFLISALGFSNRSFGQLIINASQTDVSCFGGNDGTITVNVISGTAPFRYQLVYQTGGGDVDLSDQVGIAATSFTFKTGNGSLNEPGAEAFGIPRHGLYKITVISSDPIIIPDNPKSLTVSVNEPSEVIYSTNLTPNCSGTSGAIEFTVSGGTPGYVISFTSAPGALPGGGSIGTSGGIFTESNLITGDYTFDITDANNCVESNTVTILPAAIDAPISENGPQTICEGQSQTVTINPSELNTSYQVQLNGVDFGAPIIGDGNPLLLATIGLADGLTPGGSPHTITVDASLNGCTNTLTDQIDLTVNPLPLDESIVEVGTPTICDGTDQTVTLTNSELGADYQVQINGVDFGGVFTGTGIANELISTIPAASLTSAGSPYTITVDALLNGCPLTLTDQILVTVNAAAEAGVATPQSTCPTDNAFDLFLGLTGNNTGGAWNDDDATGQLSGSIFNAAALSIVVTTTFNFTYTVTGIPPCVDDMVTLQVTVDPAASTTAPNGGVLMIQDLCQDETSVSLMANTTVGATVRWFDDAAKTNLLFTGNPYQPTLDLSTPVAPLVQYFVSQEGACGESSLTQFDVNVIAKPNAGTSTPQNACNLDNGFDLFTGLTGNDAGGTWNDDDATGALTGSIFDATTAGIVVGQSYDFTYTVLGTGACLGTDVSTTLTVTITGASAPPTGSSPISACQNSQTAPVITVSGTNVLWYDDAAMTNPSIGSGSSLNLAGLIDLSILGPTSFFATQNEGCGESGVEEIIVEVIECIGNCNFTVQVNPFPATCQFTDNGTKDGGVSFVLTGVNTNPFYSIFESDGTIIVSQSGSDFGKFLGPGTYKYKVEDLDAGCGQEGEFTVELQETKVTGTVSKAGDIACFGDPTGGSAVITVDGGNGNIFEYSADAGASWIAFSSGSTVIGLPVGEDYNILIRVDEDDLCPFSAPISISEPAAIEAVAAKLSDTYPEQDIGSFIVGSIDSDNPPFDIQLLDGDGFVIEDFQAIIPDRFGNYSHVFGQLPIGIYNAVVRDSTGCDIVLEISIESKTDVSIPNVFTPNNDGINEAFIILNKKASTKLVIVNRWGVRVFNSDDYQNDWRAEGVPDGIYFYTISMDGQAYNGSVEVWRGGAKINN
ncbi:MAG: gliding motility-associated C-terminal domain-containing protein [Cyclobacteriaceae bacterium]|nr:gliding motility-associated C-terminal domain-containing protein [Cyclobacteriaceae bacterium]